METCYEAIQPMAYYNHFLLSLVHATLAWRAVTVLNSVQRFGCYLGMHVYFKTYIFKTKHCHSWQVLNVVST